MPKAKKEVEKKDLKKKAIKRVKSTPTPKPEVEAKVEVSLDEYKGKLLGRAKLQILKTEDYKLNGRLYKKVHLANATTMVLTEADLEQQLEK